MIRFDITVDLTQMERRLLRRFPQRAQRELDGQVLKDSNKYIPKDTGNLEASGIRNTQVGNGKVIWDTPYARRLYYNPQYNFSKDTNPLAGGLWFERAKAAHKDDWVNMIRRLI